jgi:DNA (cytosine-5)-methyltransferase 1
VIKFIDLFAGTGGIRLAFQDAVSELGLESKCVKSAEIDKKACETYEINFGENPFADVTTLDEIEPFDVLLAGFPCQAFSSAGKQLGFSDTRGTLFFEVERLIRKYQPSLCFLENVRGLTTHDKGRTFNIILKTLDALGYHVEYRLLNSSNYGLAQNRVRIYIIASKDKIHKISLPSDVGASDSHKFKSFSKNNDLFNAYNYKVLEDILEDNPDQKYNCSDVFKTKLSRIVNGDFKKLNGVRLIDSRHGNSIHSWDLGIKGDCSQKEIKFMNMLVSNRRKKVFGSHQDGKALNLNQIKTFYKEDDTDELMASLMSKGYLKEKNGSYDLVCGNMSFEVFKFLDPKSISITLTASDAHKLGVYHKGRLRRITPRECARLQGYPESYILHSKDSLAYKQLGNAVSVPVIRTLLNDYFYNNFTRIIDKKVHALAL